MLKQEIIDFYKNLSYYYNNSLTFIRDDFDEKKPSHILFNPNSDYKHSESWLLNGKRHRLSGPAIIFYEQNDLIKEEQYFVNGKFLGSSNTEYNLENFLNDPLRKAYLLSEFYA